MPHVTAILWKPAMRAAIMSASVSPIHTDGMAREGMTEMTPAALPSAPPSGGLKVTAENSSAISSARSCRRAVREFWRIDARIR